MKLLDLLKLNNHEQKGFSKFKEYLLLNKAIHYFVYCLNNKEDDIEEFPNQSSFKISRVLTTLVYLKDCIEKKDIAEINSVEQYCNSILAISNFIEFADLVNFVLKKEISYVDSKLTNQIEDIIKEYMLDNVAGAEFDSANNEFIYDDIACNNTDTQYIFDEIGEIYRSFKEYNFGLNPSILEDHQEQIDNPE